MSRRFERLALLSALIVGCKRSDAAAPCEPSKVLAVVVQTSAHVNPEDGVSWPTRLLIYQLAGDSPVPGLDPAALQAQDGALFGDELVDRFEAQMYPDTRERIELTLDAKTSHVLVVALFRRPVGEGWYVDYRPPLADRRATCPAGRGESRPPSSCLYLALGGVELTGGGEPPPGFIRDALTADCGSAGRHESPRSRRR